MSLARWTLWALGAVVLGSGLIGCSSGSAKMGRYDIVVSASEPLDGTYEVDAVGVGDVERVGMVNLDVSSYVLPASPTRQNSMMRMMVLSEGQGSARLAKSDPIWDAWLGENASRNDGGIGARSVFLVARMARPDSATGRDTRLLEIPLNRARWPKTKQIDVALSPSGGLRLMTAMAPLED